MEKEKSDRIAPRNGEPIWQIFVENEMETSMTLGNDQVVGIPHWPNERGYMSFSPYLTIDADGKTFIKEERAPANYGMGIINNPNTIFKAMPDGYMDRKIEESQKQIRNMGFNSHDNQ